MIYLVCALALLALFLTIASYWNLSRRMTELSQRMDVLKGMLDGQDEALKVAAGRPSYRTMFD